MGMACIKKPRSIYKIRGYIKSIVFVLVLFDNEFVHLIIDPHKIETFFKIIVACVFHTILIKNAVIYTLQIIK